MKNESALIQIPQQVAGYWRLSAIRPDGRRRPLTDWFPNLIVNNGLNSIGTSTAWLGTCAVGTGNTAPNVTDTQLQALTATTSAVQNSIASTQSSPPYYGARTNTYRFAQGTAQGNLSEIGVGIVQDSLFSRALILDGSGNPTTITVLPDEALDATYQLRNYPPLSDVTGIVTIGGVNYNYTLRAALVTGGNWSPQPAGDIGGCNSIFIYEGGINDITSSPSGSNAGLSIVVSGYSNNSNQRDTVGTADLNTGNFPTGVSAMLALFGSQGSLGAVQIGFSTPIPKDGTKVLTLGVRQSWARKTLP